MQLAQFEKEYFESYGIYLLKCEECYDAKVARDISIINTFRVYHS